MCMPYLLLWWMKTWRPEEPESCKTCKQHAAAKNMLSFVAPHTSLTTREPGDRNPPLRLWKTALGCWTTGFMNSPLWCLSALQPIARCQFLTAFLPRILYIFTLDSLVSVLFQTQISWGKGILHTNTCRHLSILQELYFTKPSKKLGKATVWVAFTVSVFFLCTEDLWRYFKDV